MKKFMVALMLMIFWAGSAAYAAPLQFGAKTPDFKLKDVTGQSFSLPAAPWKGKVLLFLVMPIAEARTNAAVSEIVVSLDTTS